MSTMTMMIVQPDGNVVPHAEFGNAWGFQPRIWWMLCDTYKIGPGDAFMKQWPELWRADKDNTIALAMFERFVLHSTYDKAIVPAKDFAAYAYALESFYARYRDPAKVDHLGAVALAVRTLPADARGLCYWGTSVTDNPWAMQLAEEEEGEFSCRPYNVDTDTGHWWVDMSGVQV